MKRFFSFLLTIFFSFSVFAQSTKETGLTNSDVKNWAKNLTSIEYELDSLGIDYNMDYSDISKLSPKKLNQVTQILNQNGISGNNAVEKFVMITICAAIVNAESQLDQESMAVMKAMGMDPIASLKANVNAKDFSVVQANSNLVIEAISGMDNSALDESDYDDLSGGSISDFDEMDEIDDGYGNFADDLLKLQVQPMVDQVNNEAYPKFFYESLIKSKGDCGLLYPQQEILDSDIKSKFKKQKVSSGIIKLNSGEEPEELAELEDTPVITYAGVDAHNAINGTIDIKKKSLTMDFFWTEASFDKKARDYISYSYVKKNVKYSIKSAELYAYSDTDSGNKSKEYVITTKEGLVFHLWYWESFDGNSYARKFVFAGINDTADLNWSEE